MVILGLVAAKINLHQVMDKPPEKKFFSLVESAAKSVQGVLGTEKIRIQRYGPDAHVDIDIEVDPNMAVHDAHDITQLVRIEIQKKWPQVQEATVHIEPYYANDH